MEHLDGILKLTENELKAITSNGKYRSREEIDSVYKLMDIAKDVYCIWQYEEDSDEYSETYDRGGRSYRGGSYDGGSYARGRGRNARRDSMGRYSREGSYRGRSYNDAKADYIEDLRMMMESAPDEPTRSGIQRMIQQMEQG